MRVLGIVVIIIFLVGSGAAFADIHRIDIKDPGRAAKGLALLYWDIGKGTVGFVKDVFMALDDVPKAILSDIFGVGQKKN